MGKEQFDNALKHFLFHTHKHLLSFSALSLSSNLPRKTLVRSSSLSRFFEPVRETREYLEMVEMLGSLFSQSEIDSQWRLLFTRSCFHPSALAWSTACFAALVHVCLVLSLYSVLSLAIRKSERREAIEKWETPFLTHSEGSYPTSLFHSSIQNSSHPSGSLRYCSNAFMFQFSFAERLEGARKPLFFVGFSFSSSLLYLFVVTFLSRHPSESSFSFFLFTMLITCASSFSRNHFFTQTVYPIANTSSSI